MMEAKLDRFTMPDTGTLNIPVELLAKYGLKAGDEVVLIETEAGVLMGNRDQLAEQLLDYIGDKLRHKGVTFDVLMERRADIQKDLLKELYDIDVSE